VSLLTFHDVACDRGGRRLFQALSFAIPAGGAMMLTGPNGVGKSSLLRLAAGLSPPATGRIERPERLALMTEAAALDPELPLSRALCFWATLDGQASRVADALEAVGLAHLAEVPVRLLSTGQRRRAALARVIAADAPLWLLDEPANGLDGAAVERLEAAVAVHRAQGGAVLIASHLDMALPDAARLRL
jgi:heme exporter protein A